MRFVIQHQNVLHSHQIGHDALQHLSFSLESVERFAASLQQRTPAFRYFHPLAQSESVVVRDNNFRLVQFLQQIRGHQLPAGVVAIGIVRLEHAQAILDGQPGRHHKKTARETRAAGAPDSVHRLPRDKHGHDCRLTGTSGELERETHQFRIRVVVRVLQVVEDRLSRLSLRRDFGQPYGRFDRL